MSLKLRSFAVFGILLTALLALAAKDFVPPRAFHAKTYPARDEHPMEGVTIAADPYDTADKADIFSVHYLEAGFLPINLIVSNDNDQPVALTEMKVELVTVDKVKMTPASRGDLQRRFTRTPRGGQAPRPPLPIPFPRSTPKVSGHEALDEFERARFMAKAVEPHSNQAGFFFFDVQGLSHPLAGAHLYISGLLDGKGSELMFFDIPLEKYLSYTPPK